MLSQIVILLPMFVSMVLALVWMLDMAVDLHSDQSGSGWAMMFFLVACTLLYGGHAVYFSRFIPLIPVSDSIYSFCSPAVFPLYYIYVCELTYPRSAWRHAWAWLLPSVVCGVAVSVGYILMDSGQTSLFIDDYLYHNDWSRLHGEARAQAYFHWMLKLVFGVQILPIALLGIRRINRFNNRVERNMSDGPQNQLLMVKLLFVLFILTTVLSTVSNFLGRYRFVDDVMMLAIPSTLFSVLIFLQVYIAMRQPVKEGVRREVDRDESGDVGREPEKETAAKEAAVKRMRELRNRIEKLMDDEQLFLQYGLKISDLAELLCCNRNYIYRAINIEMGISFTDYVNKKRIDYAKRLIQATPDLPMNELYMRAGFSSTSSFYRCFSQYVGCSPKEYLKRLNKFPGARGCEK
jgi:AraC-like DNA-binding protein